MSGCNGCYKEYRSAGLHSALPESGSKLCKRHQSIQDDSVKNTPEHDPCECGSSVFCAEPFMDTDEMEKADKLVQEEGLRALQKKIWEDT